jgi:hypothetical protein
MKTSKAKSKATPFNLNSVTVRKKPVPRGISIQDVATFLSNNAACLQAAQCELPGIDPAPLKATLPPKGTEAFRFLTDWLLLGRKTNQFEVLQEWKNNGGRVNWRLGAVVHRLIHEYGWNIESYNVPSVEAEEGVISEYWLRTEHKQHCYRLLVAGGLVSPLTAEHAIRALDCAIHGDCKE